MTKEQWKHIKETRPQSWAAEPDTNSKHPGAIGGGPLNFKRPKLRRQRR